MSPIGRLAGQPRGTVGQCKRSLGFGGEDCPIETELEPVQVDRTPEASHDHLSHLCRPHGLGRLGLGGRFERRKPAQFVTELGRCPGAGGDGRRDGRLERRDSQPDSRQLLVERASTELEPSKKIDIEDALAKMCNLGVRGLGRRRDLRCLFGRGRGGLGASVELDDLVGERAPTCIQLQQDRLGGRSREPQLASIGVVAVAGLRDNDATGRLDQPLVVDEPDSVEKT
jgi:hypothetical protein